MRPRNRKTLINGDVVETTLGKHKTGERFIKRSVVAKGIRSISLATVSITAPPAVPQVAATKSAKRNAKKLAKAVEERPTAVPKSFRDRTHVENPVDQAAYVTTTNEVPKVLRRIKARTGSHVEQFQRDYEMAGSDLRSASLDGAGGGSSGAVPFPMAKVQAIDRLRSFEESNVVAFRMCEAVLIFNATPTTIHKNGGPQHVIVSHMIREAIEDLAGFYTPKRKRPDKTLAALVKVVDEAKRKADSNRS